MSESHYAALKDLEIAARIFVSDPNDHEAFIALATALTRSEQAGEVAAALAPITQPVPRYGPSWSRPATQAP